jgi:hypothetical protein
MMTYTGRVFYPYDMRLEDFCIEDVAHALSMLCRYGGHCRRFYCVAEHSVLVSRMVSRASAFAALMHDATEAYLVDMPKPIKTGFPQYKDMEAKIWAMICEKWGLPAKLPEEVHRADGEALWHEMAALMPTVPAGHGWGMGACVPAVVRPELVRCWSPGDAERFFLRRFEELRP